VQNSKYNINRLTKVLA